MKRPAAALAAILLTAQIAAPDEALKVRALRLGYSLNADSMIRSPALGSIDVSGLLFVPDNSLIERPAVDGRQVPIPKVQRQPSLDQSQP